MPIFQKNRYGGAVTMLIADESENEIMLADVMNGYADFHQNFIKFHQFASKSITFLQKRFTEALQQVLQRQQDALKDGWLDNNFKLSMIFILNENRNFMFRSN